MTDRQPQVPKGTKREILIDGDILIYQTALQNEEAVNWGDGLWTLHSYEDKCPTGNGEKTDTKKFIGSTK